MTVSEKVKTAITPVIAEVYQNVYTGTKTTWVTFNFPKDSVIIAGDDKPIIDNVPVQIHLFCPTNPMTYKKTD